MTTTPNNTLGLTIQHWPSRLEGTPWFVCHRNATSVVARFTAESDAADYVRMRQAAVEPNAALREAAQPPMEEAVADLTTLRDQHRATAKTDEQHAYANGLDYAIARLRHRWHFQDCAEKRAVREALTKLRAFVADRRQLADRDRDRLQVAAFGEVVVEIDRALASLGGEGGGAKEIP